MSIGNSSARVAPCEEYSCNGKTDSGRFCMGKIFGPAARASNNENCSRSAFISIRCNEYPYNASLLTRTFFLRMEPAKSRRTIRGAFAAGVAILMILPEIRAGASAANREPSLQKCNSCRRNASQRCARLLQSLRTVTCRGCFPRQMSFRRRRSVGY
jgi:hypothetical protein